MRLDELRTAVRPGHGLIARFPTALLVVTSEAWKGAPTVVRLVEACRAPASEGSDLAGRIDSIAARPAEGVIPAFCVVTDGAEGLSILVHGDIQVSICGGGPVVNLLGNDGSVWRMSVPDRVASLAVGDRSQESDGDATDGWLDLRDGLVPGSGVILVPNDVRPGVDVPDADVPDADVPDVPTRVAEPVTVWGVHCKHGHFNHPDARYCGTCGTHMVHGRRDLVLGPRPIIGFLVLDDGSTYKLDSDYLIGAAPENHESVRSGAARGLMLSDDEGTVSPVHAGIRLDEWEAYLSDQGSRFGTHVWTPGSSGWTRLDPRQQLRLEPGCHVLLGRRRVIFEPLNH